MILQKIANMVIMGKCYLTNLSGALLAGSFINSGEDVDINTLLSGDGAAQSGGSLSQASELVDSYGKAGYSIAKKGAIYLAAIGLILFFIGFIVHGKNAQKKAESKEATPWIVIGVIGIFTVGGFLIFGQSIGGSLFTTTTK